MTTMFPRQPQSDQTNFSYQLSPLTLTPALVGIPQAINTGVRGDGWVVITNESPYRVQVMTPSSGSQTPIDPQTANKVKLKSGDQVIYITASVLLPGAAPTSLVNFQVYDKEPPGQYPMELTRQTGQTGVSGQFGFSATAGFGATTNTIQVFNVFNPANNTKNFVFYSCRVFTNDTSHPTFNFAYFVGADNNLANVATPVSHVLSANPPATNAHCTFVDANTGSAGPIMEVYNMAGNATEDIILNPDSAILYPGVNLIIFLSSGTTGHVVRFTLKWNEQ